MFPSPSIGRAKGTSKGDITSEKCNGYYWYHLNKERISVLVSQARLDWTKACAWTTCAWHSHLLAKPQHYHFYLYVRYQCSKAQVLPHPSRTLLAQWNIWHLSHQSICIQHITNGNCSIYHLRLQWLLENLISKRGRPEMEISHVNRRNALLYMVGRGRGPRPLNRIW